MPTAVGPNTKGEENLVFAYDLGDVSNSYRGEPTTNLLATTDIGSFARETGATKTATGNSFLGVPTYYIATNPTEVFRSVYTSFTNVGTGTYAVSIWYRNNGTTAVGQDIYFGGANRGTGGGSIPADGKWHRRVVYVTNPSDTIFEPRPYTLVEAAAPQVEYNSHTTQFTSGTRSATQGLQDLTGNSTIDLTNVSFDSNAQMTFDGTNDSLVVGNNTVLKNNNTSIEFIIKYLNTPNGDIIQFGVGSGTYAQYYYRAYSGNSYWNWYPAAVTGEGYITIPNSALPLNQYHHIVMTGDDQGYVQFYINGVAQSGATRAAVVQPANWTPADLTVGGFNWDGYSSSEIPYVKIYNRVLTASEIQQNFTAIKGRFNI